MPIHSELKSKIHNLILGLKDSDDPWYVILIEFIKLVLNIVKDILTGTNPSFDKKELEDFLVLEYMTYLNIKIIPDFIEEPIIRALVHELIALVVDWFSK